MIWGLACVFSSPLLQSIADFMTERRFILSNNKRIAFYDQVLYLHQEQPDSRSLALRGNAYLPNLRYRRFKFIVAR